MRTIFLFVCLATGLVKAQLTPWYTSAFPTSTSGWNINGAQPLSPAHLTDSSANGVSLIRNFSGSPQADYEVNATLKIGATGGSTIVYLRASADARLGQLVSTGTFYAVEFAALTVQNGVCSTNLKLMKRVGGTLQQIFAFPVGCFDGMQWRVVIRGATIAIRQAQMNSLTAWWEDPNPIVAGMPGVGVMSSSAANGISSVGFYAIETQIPWITGGIAASAWPTRVDIQWAGAQDGPNSSGVMIYMVFRMNNLNGVYEHMGEVPGSFYADRSVQPSMYYKYLIVAIDTHLNTSGQYHVAITTPPAGGREPRRIGVRPDGVYFGGAGEQIDVQSGNLNFTLPLFTAKGRNGLTASFSLNTNTQLWRKDVFGTWDYGRDIGYGHGFRLLLGSVTPVYSSWGQISHFVYTDSTGAEHRLNRDTTGWWRSTEGSLVAFNEATYRLHFPDGTFWNMWAESAQSELDAGTLYPVTVQDPSGNQIRITYRQGSGSPVTNSSGRIHQVQELYGAGSWVFDTVFTWDATNHLSRIQTLDRTYSFHYHVPTSLHSPWGTAVGHTRFLWKVREERTNADTDFWYVQVPAHSGNLTGELNRVVLPTGGEIRWEFQDIPYSEQRVVREVWTRHTKDRGATTEETHIFGRSAEPDRLYHPFVNMIQGSSTEAGQRIWRFSSDARLTQEERWTGDGVLKLKHEHVWSVSPGRDGLAGIPYIRQTSTTLIDSGTALTTVQERTLDTYGNVTWYKSNSREWTYKYLHETLGANFAPYKARYIVDRLQEERVYLPENKVLRSIVWDSATPGSCTAYQSLPSGPYQAQLWEAQQGCYFGLPVSVTVNGVQTSIQRYVTGVVRSATSLGKTVTATTDWRTSYAVPSTFVADGQTTIMAWDTMLRLDTATGPNGGIEDTNYDTYGRPVSRRMADGQTVTYSYPNLHTVVESSNGSSVTKTLNGFGQVQRDQTSDGVMVDYQYEACLCSPFGKVKRVSVPYKTGAPVWNVRHHDIIGRMTQIDHAGGGSTTYEYGLSTAPYGIRQTVQITPPGNRWKKYFKDLFGDLREVEEPQGTNASVRQVTSYTYDIEHRLTRVEMARGGTTQVRTFEYYSDGLLKKTVFPETGQTDYTYDANKRLETKIDARLRKTAWEYDQYGRVKIVRRYLTSGASQDIADERVEYYYDAAPTVFHDGTPVSLPSGVAFAASNILGRLVMTRTGSSRILELYSYTAGGQIKQKRLETEGHRLDVTYEYDANGRISTVTGPAGRKFKYSYNAAGKPSQLKEALTGGFPDTLHATAVFDGWGRLQSVGGMSYEYNAMGQLSRYTRGSYDVTYNYVNAQGVNDGRLASQTAGGVMTSYSYDFMGRLQSATRAGQWLQQYEFDGFGNLTKRTVTLPGQPPVVEGNYPVNAATNRRTGSGTYDAAGNHVWHPSVVYDTDNRMVAAPGPSAGTVETYSYAPDNRRVVRKVPGASGFTEITLWVGSTRAAKRVIPNGAGGTTDTDVIVFAGRRFYAAGVQATPAVAEGSDRLGSSAEHKPFGENAPGVFATYSRDGNSTGLDYADQRYYSPGTGRFLSADPYLASGGTADPSSWNRYAYVEGDPINNVDPSGLIAARVVCTADLSSEDCLGQGFEQSSTGNGGGGMYCDQAKLPFISTPAECSAWSHAAFFGLLALAAASSGDDDEEEEPDCFARLKDRDVEATSLPGVHTFWWVQSRTGQQYIISGGPNNGYLEGGAYPGNSTRDDSYKAHTHWDSGLSPENCDGVERMIAAAQNFPEGRVRYHFLGPNSNSFARYVGDKGGFTPSPPFTAWGWNHRIPGVR